MCYAELTRGHARSLPLPLQANTTPPKFNRDEAKGRGALLGDIHKGAKLKKVGVVHDRSAPILESKATAPLRFTLVSQIYYSGGVLLTNLIGWK